MFVLCGKKIRFISNLGAVARLVYKILVIENCPPLADWSAPHWGAFKSGSRAPALRAILLVF